MQTPLDYEIHYNSHASHERPDELPRMIQGPNVRAYQVKVVELLLELQVAVAFPHSLQSSPRDVKSNVAATKVSRAILLLLS